MAESKTAALLPHSCQFADLASLIQRITRLTDDVGSLCVVCELVLILVFAVLVERALVASLQNPLQKLELAQAGTQAVDPQSFLVTVDGPTNVRFACGPRTQVTDVTQTSAGLGGACAYRCTDVHPAFSECPEVCVPREGCRTPVTKSSPAGPHRRWDPLNTGNVGINLIKSIIG